jgi:ABC-type bacteriocin/lantibiotic exporter with double-glycine peptidase domain
MEITVMHLLLGILAGAIPVVIIFLTLKFIRKKRESNNEHAERKQHSNLDLTDQLKSVKEERMEKKGIRKTKN